MNKHLENRISMFYTVRDACAAHTATWTPLVPFATAHTEFLDALKGIEDNMEKQDLQLLGIAKDKALKKDEMVEKALEVAQAAYAYATDSTDLELQGKMDFSRSDLVEPRDTVVAQRCQGIHTEASAVAASLVAYGIDAADLLDLQGAITKYVDVVSAPRTAVTVRKGATAAIETGVRDGLAILNDRMDKLMPAFKLSDPDFHQEYFDARIIVDLGGPGEEEEEPPVPPGP
ncbi:MAG: hypothetical protein IPP83_10155 [Flavobacteriales bacterium]|nr:hypothetical protein [Flavobacteriales bacterium]